MRKKYYHQKLIRDKIPKIMVASGDEFKTKILRKPEFDKELTKKLAEEVKELQAAPVKGLVNELADVLELLKSIAENNKIDFKKIEKYRAEKRKKRGGFKKRLFLVWSTGKSGR